MGVIDFHCDTILRIMEEGGAKDSLKENNFNVDIEKLKKGDYIAQFFAMFVNLKEVDNPLEACLKMIDRFYMELGANNDSIAFADGISDINENMDKNKISAFLTIEEGATIKGSIENLRNFYRLGVRLMTLTWNYPNEIGYPNCKECYMDKGLTSFGHDVVYEMNNLGMIIDVSHLSDGGFYDVARLSKKPFVASHSNARAKKESCRNLTDDMIKVLAKKGGVMGINFERSFLGEGDTSRVDYMVDHIKHIKNVGGIDVISLGTDFDGIDQNLEIKNAGEMYKLIDKLKEANFTEGEIEKILHLNAIRVIGDILN